MGRCCQGLCRSFIATLNTLVLIVSLALLAVSIYAIVEQYRFTVNGETLAAWVVWIPFAIAIVLTIVSLVGCCTVIEDNKCCIGIYALLQFVFGIIIILAGIAMILGVQAQQDIADTAQNPSDLPDNPVLGTSVQLLQSFELGAMQSCCPLADNNLITTQCGASGVTGICRWDENAYNSGLNLDTNDQPACDSIQAINVCPPSTNITIDVAGQFQIFTANLAGVVKSSLQPAGIAFCVLGGLLLLAFVGSCYLACCARPPAPKQRQQQYAQSAQQTAGTGAPHTMAMA